MKCNCVIVWNETFTSAMCRRLVSLRLFASWCWWRFTHTKARDWQCCQADCFSWNFCPIGMGVGFDELWIGVSGFGVLGCPLRRCWLWMVSERPRRDLVEPRIFIVASKKPFQIVESDSNWPHKLTTPSVTLWWIAAICQIDCFSFWSNWCFITHVRVATREASTDRMFRKTLNGCQTTLKVNHHHLVICTESVIWEFILESMSVFEQQPCQIEFGTNPWAIGVWSRIPRVCAKF